MNWFILASLQVYRALIAVLSFCNVLEDEAPGRPRRLSLTNVSFVGAMILGAAVVTKSVLTVEPASVTEFAMTAAVSVVAALLKERKSQRRRDDFESEDCEV